MRTNTCVTPDSLKKTAVELYKLQHLYNWDFLCRQRACLVGKEKWIEIWSSLKWGECGQRQSIWPKSVSCYNEGYSWSQPRIQKTSIQAAHKRGILWPCQMHCLLWICSWFVTASFNSLNNLLCGQHLSKIGHEHKIAVLVSECQHTSTFFHLSLNHYVVFQTVGHIFNVYSSSNLFWSLASNTHTPYISITIV